MKVLYYAHDQGSGHLRNAVNFANAAQVETVVATANPAVARTNLDFITLPSDVVDGYQPDPTSPFHYVPVGSARIQSRFNAMHDALRKVHPDVVVVDVSAEVTAFSVLSGYPTVARLMHGVRDDLAHQSMYRTANSLVAYFSEGLSQPEHLNSQWSNKVTYAPFPQLMSNFKTFKAGERSDNLIVVQSGLGGKGYSFAALNDVANKWSQYEWRVVGKVEGATSAAKAASNLRVLGTVDDVGKHLASATCVVSAAGHNSLVAVGRSGAPFVLFPEERPYEEQKCYARCVSRATGCEVIDNWQQDWPILIERAVTTAAHTSANADLSSLLTSTPEEFANSISKTLEMALSCKSNS